MSEITRSPLTWPSNVGRTPPHLRTRCRFEEKSIEQARVFLLAELDRLNKASRGHTWSHGVILSTNLRLRNDGMPYSNQPEPADPAVAVYFDLMIVKPKRPIVLTCDKWSKVAWNIYAIAKDIEAQRARERWGCARMETAFLGYLALPERAGGKPWWETLGVPPNANAFQINEAYRQKSKLVHPDTGGSHEAFVALKEAHEQALQALQALSGN